MRSAVPTRPSGPAAYERWFKRMAIIVASAAVPTDSGGWGSLDVETSGRSSPARVSRDPRGGWPGSTGPQVRLAVAGEGVVRRLPHQLHELGRTAEIDRLGATWASVLPEQYQSRSWPPGPQPRRSYSPIVTSVYDVSVGGLDAAVGPADRQLPAHIGLGLQRVPALLQREPVEGAAWPPGNPRGCGRCRRCWPSTSTPGLGGSLVGSIQSFSPDLSRRAATARLGVSCSTWSPPAVGRPVGEVRAERAAARVGQSRRSPGSPARKCIHKTTSAR